MSDGSYKIKNSIYLDPQSADPSNPAEGDIFFSDGTSRAKGAWQYKDATWAEFGGAGSGGINYLEGDNSNAENGVGDWLSYADAAGENPVDGTGGAATVTFAQNATTPLRGDADFKLVKDAADRQGEGAGCAFTIDIADKAQKLTISLDYDASHAGYADDDIRFSVYDVTNASLIRINGEDLKGGKGSHVAQFQAASDSVSYRLIAHVSSTSAVAYDVYFDNIQVGPSSTNVGSANEVVAEGRGNAGTSLTANVTNIDFTETRDTSGSFDGTTFTAPETGEYLVTGAVRITASSSYGVNAYINTVQDTRLGSSTTLGDNPINGIIELNKGDALTFRSTGSFTLSSSDPVRHWIVIQKIGTSSEAATIGSGRDVVVRGSDNSGAAITANTERIDFTVVEDTTASWSQTDSNGDDTFTAPESGYYSIVGSVRLSASTTISLSAYINGTSTVSLNSNVNTARHSIGGAVYLDKGDTLDIRSNTTFTLLTATIDHWIHIQKLNSGKTALETETVAARYTSNSGASVADTANVIYEDIVSDTHNAYNPSTGVYTIPISGWYSMKAKVRPSSNNSIATSIEIDGTVIDRFIKATTTDTATLQMVVDIEISKGQTVEVVNTTGSARTLSSDGTYNTFSITRIK